MTVLLVVLIGVAVALAVQSVVAYRRARDVEELLGRAQASALQKAMTPGMRMVRDAAGLERMLEEHRDDGLRYVALLAPGPQVHAEAGVSMERATVVPDGRVGPGALNDVRVGTRWRVYSPMPPPGRRGPDGGPPRMGGPPGGPPHRPGPPPFVIEVEPNAGGALRTEATRSLVLGLASAVALLAVTAWLVRWLRQREQMAARVAHDRRLAALGEMSAVMAHEIRNPLASLKGHAQLLVENLDGKEREQAKAQRVVDEAVRLERLTNDLLEFARTGRIERAACDPVEVLRDAAGVFEDERLVVETAGAPARWSLDAGRMRQVLANLIGNALEAARDAAPESKVTVSVGAEHGKLVYRVRDRGPGLPAGDAARLFEPFHTTRAAGVGLGLAVAHRLVELHGGQLSARNHPEGGAELTVSIPEAR